MARRARRPICASGRLPPSPLFPLVLTVAKYKSGMERVVRVHRAVEPFRDELIAVTSGELARTVGV